METYIGFDSAWTDDRRAPGAICAISMEKKRVLLFYEPRLAGFDQALSFIREVSSKSEYTLIALDQPTKVPNLTGMRPVERLAASLVSWVGGGVQPANRQKVGMFCDASPIWRFLEKLSAIEDPAAARDSKKGLYLLEVFPALALISYGTEFFARPGHPKYNPTKKKPSYGVDWTRVVDAAAEKARVLACDELQRYLEGVRTSNERRKEDHDKLDACICLLTGLQWRHSPGSCLLLGDLKNGYMVTPATGGVREYLERKAYESGVPLRMGHEV